MAERKVTLKTIKKLTTEKMKEQYIRLRGEARPCEDPNCKFGKIVFWEVGGHAIAFSSTRDDYGYLVWYRHNDLCLLYKNKKKTRYFEERTLARVEKSVDRIITVIDNGYSIRYEVPDGHEPVITFRKVNDSSREV